ncbi:ral guanine nucleotide dissociation stimulator-like 1 [Heterodontus francisci]|uniref:ral guanine nucleotide dissociation stimulator-like 1 n=1 Tax=Heterodontus francisci TaxID=7792 RepID=UPI00355C7BD4
MAKQERDQGMETVPAPGPSQESRGVPTNPETEETRQRTRSGAPLQVIPVWTLTPPPLRQTPSNSIQDWVEEIEEGASYNVILKEERIQQTPNKSARWQEVEGDQVPPGHTSSQSTKKIRAIKTGTLQQLVNNLLTASGDGDSNYTRIFLSTYRAFASPEAVLDLLLDSVPPYITGWRSDGTGVTAAGSNMAPEWTVGESMESVTGRKMMNKGLLKQESLDPILYLIDLNQHEIWAFTSVDGDGKIGNRSIVDLLWKNCCSPQATVIVITKKGRVAEEFLKCVQENFLDQYVSSAMRKEALLDLVLGNEVVLKQMPKNMVKQCQSGTYVDSGRPSTGERTLSLKIPPWRAASQSEAGSCSATAEAEECRWIQARGTKYLYMKELHSRPVKQPARFYMLCFPCGNRVTCHTTLFKTYVFEQAFGNAAVFTEVHTNVCKNYSTSFHNLAITSVLRAWLDLCSEDFCEVPNYTCLQKLLEHLRQTMPGSDLEKRAHQLLEQFQQQDLAAQELDNSYHGKIMFNRGEEGDAKVEEVEDKQDIFSFPSGLVAEQLTYMDAELFKKVVIHHCLGCIWSQRHKKQNQHLATTIRATITQFNNITKCVISSILKDRNLKPDQRARLLEKWITIAEKSRTINNYSSLRAIVAALQSSPIYKLRKTWAAVSNELQILDVLAGLPETLWCTSNNWLIARSLSSFCSRMSSMGLFEELEEQCCHRINYHLGEEDVMQGTVPYLGTFLTDLTMLDTALPDYVGDLINFEKKRREFEVIAQIKLLKSACNNYCITPVPKFLRWFNNQQYLTDEESYNVSREIEAAPESSPSSPKDRKSLVKCLSLLFHGTEVAERTPSKSSDQPKSPRIGSSGENMDSVSDLIYVKYKLGLFCVIFYIL